VSIRTAVLLLLAGACAHGQKTPQFETAFFFDRNNASLRLYDFAMPSAECGLALGILQEGRNRGQHVAIRSRDNGRTWTIARIKPQPRSLYFLPGGAAGWVAAWDGVHHTVDCGEKWQRVLKKENLVRVYFRDARNGYALGAPKTVLVTADGGGKWSPLPAAAEPQANAERSMYTWAAFHSSGWGMITGFHRPERREPDAPAWMDPETAEARRQWPSLSLMLQTPDGGATWKPSVESVIGQIGRVRFSNKGAALVLVEFEYTFEWPSDVVQIETDRKTTRRVFRRKDHSTTDILFDPADRAYVAGFEPLGRLRNVPIPGKVRIARSDDLISWQWFEVDYRAVAQRVMLANGPGGTIWAATDTGMILRLAE
jgi:hypothetical protein